MMAEEVVNQWEIIPAPTNMVGEEGFHTTIH